MRRKRQQTQLQSIGEVLFSVLKKRGMTSKIEENALIKLWPKAVGPQIASKTKPDCLRNGTLFVKTISSVWVQQLHFIKEEIREKLNQLSGKSTIKEIRFLVGHTLALEKEEENISVGKKTMLNKRDKEMIARINASSPDVLWIGLSTPKQEHWMYEHRTRLCVPAVIGVGAAFDFHAGVKEQAPRWMREHGLEWLFRLLQEPRRLWRRYLVYGSEFLFWVALEQLGLRKFD